MCYAGGMQEEPKQLLIWESEVKSTSEGQAVVTARKPLFRMTVKQAARLLGCDTQTVCKAFRHGKLSGWKPGAVAVRKDGRRSNASLVLDAESVLRYKESVTERGVY